MLDSRHLGSPSSTSLYVSILGPLQVRKGGRVLDLGSPKQQLVLACLLCHPNSPVPMDSLAAALWPRNPPRTARKNIQVYVSALRGLLGPALSGERIAYRPGGYVLSVDESELDSLRFARHARATHRLSRPDQAIAVAGDLAAALDLWRGPVLAELTDVPLVDEAAQQLHLSYLKVFEDWAEAEIAAGGALEAVDRVAELAQRNPFRERLRMIQMTALAQVGRRSEALAVYDELRQAMAKELGIAPGQALGRLYQSLLDDEDDMPVGFSGRQVPCCPVPRDLPLFVGREREASQLGEALAGNASRMALLTGPTGAGKTALAVHMAHELSPQFPDGCYFIRLGADNGTVRPVPEVLAELGSLLDAVGVPGKRCDTARMWQQWLAGHRALVVLDDVRREAQVWPLLPQTGDSVVIVTARRRLSGLGAACCLDVGPLGPHEAVELLGRVVGPARVGADRAAAERIVMATGLLPLGVILVGTRVSMLRHVPLREYGARLGSPEALLAELGAAGDGAIRDRLAEAVADLPASARTAFVKLGALPAPVFTLGEAAEAMSADEEATIRILEDLLEANAIGAPEVEVVAHEVLYEMPALIYAYARDLARAGGA